MYTSDTEIGVPERLRDLQGMRESIEVLHDQLRHLGHVRKEGAAPETTSARTRTNYIQTQCAIHGVVRERRLRWGLFR